MGEAPAFQFYVSDFLLGTIDFTNAQAGAYIRLLCRQWDKGSVSEEKFILSTKDLPSDEQEAVKSKFLYENGEYRNIRLENTRIKQEEFRKKQRENGKLGGRPSIKGLGYSGLTQTKAKKSSSSSSSSLSSSLHKEKSKEKNMPSATIDRFTKFLESLKTTVAYTHINLEWELGKMDTWLALPANKGRKKTQRFVLNWLNKIDPGQQTPIPKRKSTMRDFTTYPKDHPLGPKENDQATESTNPETQHILNKLMGKEL